MFAMNTVNFDLKEGFKCAPHHFNFQKRFSSIKPNLYKFVIYLILIVIRAVRTQEGDSRMSLCMPYWADTHNCIFTLLNEPRRENPVFGVFNQV